MEDDSAISLIAGPDEPSKLTSFLQDLQGTGIRSPTEVSQRSDPPKNRSHFSAPN